MTAKAVIAQVRLNFGGLLCSLGECMTILHMLDSVRLTLTVKLSVRVVS
jgi:hypothetical protein